MHCREAPSTVRIGRVTSRPRQHRLTSRSRARVSFSMQPSTRARGATRALDAVDADPEADDAAVLGEVQPVDQDSHQIQAGQVSEHQLGQGLSGRGRRTARRSPTRRQPRQPARTGVPTGSVNGQVLLPGHGHRFEVRAGNGGWTACPASAPAPISSSRVSCGEGVVGRRWHLRSRHARWEAFASVARRGLGRCRRCGAIQL